MKLTKIYFKCLPKAVPIISLTSEALSTYFARWYLMDWLHSLLPIALDVKFLGVGGKLSLSKVLFVSLLPI